MRKMVLSMILMLNALFLYAYDKSIIQAWKHGARVDTFVKVVDETNAIVSNANISVVFGNSYSPNAKADVLCGQSDEYGVFRIKGNCKYSITINAKADDYYRGTEFVQLDAMTNDPAVVNGVWQTDTNGYVVVMKRVRNPVILKQCPQRNLEHKIPVFDKWVAYDFDSWDFCPPYGKGENDDMLIRFTANKEGKRFTDRSIELSFTNHAHAGLYVQRIDDSSELWYDYAALTNTMIYSDSVKYETTFNEKGKTLVCAKLDSGEYMTFRTRTKLDADGNIVEANYGRILGPLCYCEYGGVGYVRFSNGWFNPNVNDPNLEDGDYWAYLERERAKQKKKATKGFFDFLKFGK